MNDAFLSLLEHNRDHAAASADRFDDLQDGQAPEVVTVCCSDSRVPQNGMWGIDDPGHAFTVGNIGNRVLQRTASGDVVSGDVLYPIVHTGTETAIVVGHTGCGAVTATYDSLSKELTEPPGIEHCVDLLASKLAPGLDELPDSVGRQGSINRLVEYNVDRQIDALAESDDVPDDVDLVGVVYDFQDVYSGTRGEIHVVNVDTERNPERLRETYPDIKDRIERLWTY